MNKSSEIAILLIALLVITAVTSHVWIAIALLLPIELFVIPYLRKRY